MSPLEQLRLDNLVERTKLPEEELATKVLDIGFCALERSIERSEELTRQFTEEVAASKRAEAEKRSLRGRWRRFKARWKACWDSDDGDQVPETLKALQRGRQIREYGRIEPPRDF